MTDTKPRGPCPRKKPRKLTVAQMLAFRMPISPPRIAALDVSLGQAVAWQVTVVDNTGTHDYAKWAGLQAPPAAAVAAENVTPMRQPRADLARLVESIKDAVYANGNGLSVTEAIGALELAKLELLKEQEK